MSLLWPGPGRILLLSMVDRAIGAKCNSMGRQQVITCRTGQRGRNFRLLELLVQLWLQEREERELAGVVTSFARRSRAFTARLYFRHLQ